MLQVSTVLCNKVSSIHFFCGTRVSSFCAAVVRGVSCLRNVLFSSLELPSHKRNFSAEYLSCPARNTAAVLVRISPWIKLAFVDGRFDYHFLRKVSRLSEFLKPYLTWIECAELVWVGIGLSRENQLSRLALVGVVLLLFFLLTGCPLGHEICFRPHLTLSLCVWLFSTDSTSWCNACIFSQVLHFSVDWMISRCLSYLNAFHRLLLLLTIWYFRVLALNLNTWPLIWKTVLAS